MNDSDEDRYHVIVHGTVDFGDKQLQELIVCSHARRSWETP